MGVMTKALLASFLMVQAMGASAQTATGTSTQTATCATCEAEAAARAARSNLAGGIVVGSIVLATAIVAITGGNITNLPAVSLLGGWAITPSGNTLYFSFSGSNVATLDSSGNFTTIGNVTGFGTL
jgi:hypothetical protein